MRFVGKNLLILGGSSALGLELAIKAGERGLLPLVGYRDEESLEKISAKLYCQRYEAVWIDLEKEESWKDICEDYQIDYLVDFAHTDLESLITSSSEKSVSEYFQLNVASRTTLLKDVTKNMIKNRAGRLVYVSSTAASRSNKGQGFYSSAKLAIESIYRSLGIELISKGISSVSVRPGYLNRGRGEEFLKNNKIDESFITSPEDLAETILFLLSDAAHMINATEICMDGGMNAQK